MNRTEALWLHQKFCPGRACFSYVDQATGIIVKQVCRHCEVTVWVLEDDEEMRLMNGVIQPLDMADAKEPLPFSADAIMASPDEAYVHRILSTSGGHDSLLGHCMAPGCGRSASYGDTDGIRLCMDHFRHMETAVQRCAFEGCAGTPRYTNGTVFVCKKHYKRIMSRKGYGGQSS